MGKRKLIKIIAVQGVLSKKETLGPAFKGNKHGINGIRTRKAIATNQILSFGVSVCYSFEIKKENCLISGRKNHCYSLSFWVSVSQMHPVSPHHLLLTCAPWYPCLYTIRKENMDSLAVCL